MTVNIVDEAPQSGWFKVHVEGGIVGPMSLGSILNPEGALLQITDAFMYVVNDADAAATLDIGLGVEDADDTDLISAYDINGVAAGAVVAIVGKDLASEGAATSPKGIKWPATEYLNFYNPEAQISNPFEAYCYFHWIRLDAL
jgi:hypothetical protein